MLIGKTELVRNNLKLQCWRTILFQVVIACVTPKFVISQHCLKELSVADLLRKPIIPVMVDKTVWPPPGGMSLIFSQNVYINMKGNQSTFVIISAQVTKSAAYNFNESWI